MTRRTLIFLLMISLVVLLGVGAAFVRFNARQDPTKAPSVTSITNASDDDMKASISHKLTQDGNPCKPEDIAIDTHRLVEETWIIAQATIIPLPESDDARTMTYVLQVTDSKLTVIGYSGDGFSANAFPKDTPQQVIDEANTYNTSSKR